MKKSVLELTLFILLSFQLTLVLAQAPQKLSYQAVIRNGSNSLVTNANLGMQISILQGSGTGLPVYIEKQNPVTNGNGLVSIEIGTGASVYGNFSSINWANGPYFIKTETDPNGATNYTITGVSQLVSVPYSLNAKTADKALTADVVTSPSQPAITSVGTLSNLTVTSPIVGSVTGTASNVTGMVDPVHGGTGVNSASSNFVFAGPDGATGAPYFRSLVPNDLPSGSTHYIANGTTPQSLSNFNITGSGTIGNSLTINNPAGITGVTVGDNTARTLPNLKLIGMSSDNVNGGGGLEIGDGSTVAMRMMRTNDNNFKLTTNFGSNLNIIPEGNLGINTTAPAYKLDVNGTMRSTGNAIMGGTLEVGGITSVQNTTSSVDASTGALTVAGGVGVAENINVGGALNVTGDANFTGNPYGPTPPKGDNSARLATTQFIQTAINDATLSPGYSIDITSNVISMTKSDYAFLGINNSNGGGTQGLYLNWPYSDYINGVVFSNGNTFTLRAGKMYEVTATMYIYNAGAESYFYDFKNVTDNIEYSNYGAFFGEGTPYPSYTTQTIRFMYKAGYDTDFIFQRSSTNVVDPNIIGNIIVKEVR